MIMKYVSSSDICVCCGAPVPEGTQVCWGCLHPETQASTPAKKMIYPLCDAAKKPHNK